jgi:hypothetical protein
MEKNSVVKKNIVILSAQTFEMKRLTVCVNLHLMKKSGKGS